MTARILTHGGRLEIHGRQVAITWYRPPGNDVEVAERAELIAEIKAARATRRARSRGRAAALLERAGGYVLARDEDAAATPRAWIVRVYYISAGDELLAFDAGPMSEDAARGVFASYGYGTLTREAAVADKDPARLIATGRGNGAVERVEAYLVDLRPTARRAPLPLCDGARLVRLPSQLRVRDDGLVGPANHKLEPTEDLTTDADVATVGP